MTIKQKHKRNDEMFEDYSKRGMSKTDLTEKYNLSYQQVNTIIESKKKEQA